MSTPPIRDVTFFLRLVRQILLGREHRSDLRFSYMVQTRSPDLPQLPPGPHSKLSANYYCSRDARSEVDTPLVVAAPEISGKLESGEVKSKEVAIASIDRTPGKVFNWDM